MAKKKYLDEIGLAQVINVIEGQINEINEEIDNLTIGSVECDTELSDTSEKPVQNKVIKGVIDGIINGTTQVGDSKKLNSLTAEEVGASGARNLIPYPYVYTTKTQDGIEWVDNGDGTVTASGTNTNSSQNLFNCRVRTSGDSKPLVLQPGTYTISGSPSGGGTLLWYIQVGRTVNDAYNGLGHDYGDGCTFTLTEETQIQIQLVVRTADTVNLTFEPMLEIGKVAHDFVPYHLDGAKDALTIQGMDIPQFVVNENLLINPTFAINTNGQTQYVGTLFTVDCWEARNDNTTVTVHDDYITLSNTVEDAKNHYIQQPFGEYKFANQTITLSMEYRNVTGTIGHDWDSSFTFDTSKTNWTKVSFTKTIDSSGINRIVPAVLKTTAPVGSIDIRNVKLEIGKYATPFVPPNLEVEKLKCGARVGDADTVDGKHASDFLSSAGGTVNGSVISNSGSFIVDRTINNVQYRTQMWTGAQGETVIANRDMTNNSVLAQMILTATVLRYQANGVSNDVLHSGNVANYALSIGGGTVTDHIKIDKGTSAGCFQSYRTLSDGSRQFAQYWCSENSANVAVYNVKNASELVAQLGITAGKIAYKNANGTYDVYHSGNCDGNIPFVVGTQTAATGTWTGTTSFISSLSDGQTIRYWLPYAGSGNATLNLTLSDGSTTGEKNVYWRGTTRLTTHFPAGSLILLTYRSAGDVNGTTYEGWWAHADYDSGNNKVAISANAPTASTVYYPLMHTTTSGTTAVTANSGTKFHHLTGTDSTAGHNQLTLGNSTASGTAGNSTGKIALYGTTAYYTIIQPGAPTANRTITLPNASGTVVTSGNLTVPASTAYTTNQLRNTVFTTTDPGVNESTSYANGSIICVYE